MRSKTVILLRVGISIYTHINLYPEALFSARCVLQRQPTERREGIKAACIMS